MDALQAGGVIAAALNNEADLLDDPQVQATRLRDDRKGARRATPLPERHGAALGDAGEIRRPAPMFGQDNRYVLREVLELEEPVIEALFAEGVVADEPTHAGWARLSAFSGS